MKKTLAIMASCLVVIAAQAQTLNPTAVSALPALPAPTGYAVVSRDADSATYERQTYDRGPNGVIVTNTHRVVELATGLNHRLANGQWAPSTENIVISADGSSAMGTNSAHKMFFPVDIANAPIRLVTPEGLTIQSQPIALALSDGSNSVILATLTNSTGAILPSGNQVLYRNALVGFVTGSVVITYTKAGAEQDVILNSWLPEIASLGLSTNCRVQVITEFIQTPQPTIAAASQPTAAGNLEDDSVGFGMMRMIRGRAFLLGTNSPSANVVKRWMTLGGRQFLVEELPIVSIAHALDTLPASIAQSGSGKPVLSKSLVLPPQRLVQSAPKTQFLAQAAQPSQGLVLDYPITFSYSGGDYVFNGGFTYYISGPCYIYSGTFTFQPGTVLKYAQGASLNFVGNPQINWQGTAFRPVIMTAKDEDTVGETIPGSTGNPGANRYANPALAIIQNFTIQNVRIAYAQVGMEIFGSGGKLTDAQFVNCQQGIVAANTGNRLWVENALFSGAQTVFSSLFGVTLQVQNSTIANCNCLESGQTPGYNYNTLILTNCILANVSIYCGSGSNFDLFLGDHNGFYACSPFGTNYRMTNSYPFRSMDAGSYYLTSNSYFMDAGTINIDPALLAELPAKTTQAPTPLTNCTVSGLTLTPIVPRDTNTPDLGYHYDPLDYMVCQVTVQFSPLTLNDGVALGLYGGSAFNLAGASVSSTGTPKALNHLVDYLMVQEEPVLLGGRVNTIFNVVYGPIDSVQAQFTDISVWHQGPSGYCFLCNSAGNTYPVLQFLFQNCWLRGVEWDVAPTTMTTVGTAVTLWNNLFDCASMTFMDFGELPGPPYGPPSSMTFSLQNNSFHGGFLLLNYDNAGHSGYVYPNCPVYDNLFDNCQLYASGNLTSLIQNGHNGYVNTSQLPGGGSGNVGRISISCRVKSRVRK